MGDQLTVRPGPEGIAAGDERAGRVDAPGRFARFLLLARQIPPAPRAIPRTARIIKIGDKRCHCYSEKVIPRNELLVNTESSSLLELVIYIHFNFVFTFGPILRQGQVSVYDVFERLGCVVDILDFLVLAAISINYPPGESHFSARFHFLRS